LKSIVRHKRFYKNKKNTQENGDLGKSGTPYAFRIHPRLRPVLEKIGIPEPKPFIPDPFQIESLEALQHSDVLVTAPTGSGKTFIAIEGIAKVYADGGKSWYASPLKALSNAKYEEFSARFGAENVGILTGDRKENVHAPIIVGTTEILRNQLYDTMHRGEDLDVDLVVLDEAHYLGDEDRGVVWEEVLIYLPSRVRVLLLSATIRNAQQVCDWLEWLRQRPCRLVASYERPVPLFPLFLFPSGELAPLSTRKGLNAKIRAFDPKTVSRQDFPDIPKLLDALRQANLLPAIFFLKSRADCEKAITLAAPHPTSKGVKGSKRPDAFKRTLNKLLETYPFLRHHKQLDILRRSRVGAHHGGQLPHWKLLLEKLMQKGLLDAIFSTSTVAAGVNFPARTVVVPQSDRFNGKEFVSLSATNLLQMTGRAGRRGMDEIGFVLVVPSRYQDPQLVHDLLRSPPDPIISQIKINFSMVLNLLLSHAPEEIRTLFASSMATFQNIDEEAHVADELQSIREELQQWLPEISCESLERMAEVRPEFMFLSERIHKARKAMRQQASVWSFQHLLAPGRIFLSRRGTPYMSLSHPQWDGESVEAVRLVYPLRSRKGQVRTHRVHMQRIRDIGQMMNELPPLTDKEEWEALTGKVESQPFQSALRQSSPEQPSPMSEAAQELTDQTLKKASLPCTDCNMFGPCHKSTGHPFSRLTERYFEYCSKVQTVQEQLWRSFLLHFHLLQEEGYVDSEGKLTEDGLWASKLRLDQPLLISEGIRRGVFPSDDPALLAALVAPFVMDKDRRPGDAQLSTLVWKYPDLAKPFFKMLQDLQPLRDHLVAAGFSSPPLPFWTLVTVYHWALGEPWDSLRNISGMDEGDLAMVILRTADHLRQIESLSETHPRLAASARKGIEMILREPVLVD
jgi:superfamily II RNA helicase